MADKLKSKLYGFLGISVLLHAVIFGCLFFLGKTNEITKQEMSPIKTYFIPVAVQPFSSDDKKEEHEPKQPTINQNTGISSSKAEKAEITLENESKPNESKGEIIEELDKEVKKAPELTEIETILLPKDSLTTGKTTTTSKPTVSSTQQLLDQIESLNQKKQADMGVEFTKNIKRNHVISLSKPLEFSQEYLEQVANTGQLVDCSNQAKQILSVISSLTNGSVKCQSLPEIQSFIDKRLQKE